MHKRLNRNQGQISTEVTREQISPIGGGGVYLAESFLAIGPFEMDIRN